MKGRILVKITGSGKERERERECFVTQKCLCGCEGHRAWAELAAREGRPEGLCRSWQELPALSTCLCSRPDPGLGQPSLHVYRPAWPAHCSLPATVLPEASTAAASGVCLPLQSGGPKRCSPSDLALLSWETRPRRSRLDPKSVLPGPLSRWP